MLNNKGFAVSAVLYTLLIAFLLFLGVALASLSSSSGLVGNSNNDIIDGTNFEAMQVIPVISGKTCGSDYQWYQGDALVKIKSRYGTRYWPKDFYKYDGVGTIGEGTGINGNLEVQCINTDGSYGTCAGKNINLGVGEVLTGGVEFPIDGGKAYIEAKDYDLLKSAYEDLQRFVDDFINNNKDLQSGLRTKIDAELGNGTSNPILGKDLNYSFENIEFEAEYVGMCQIYKDVKVAGTSGEILCSGNDRADLNSYVLNFSKNLGRSIKLKVGNEEKSIDKISISDVDFSRISQKKDAGNKSYEDTFNKYSARIPNETDNSLLKVLFVTGVYLGKTEEAVNQFKNLYLYQLKSGDETVASLRVGIMRGIAGTEYSSEVTNNIKKEPVKFMIKVHDKILGSDIELPLYDVCS